jgi:hypothetical protein
MKDLNQVWGGQANELESTYLWLVEVIEKWRVGGGFWGFKYPLGTPRGANKLGEFAPYDSYKVLNPFNSTTSLSLLGEISPLNEMLCSTISFKSEWDFTSESNSPLNFTTVKFQI